VKVTSFSTAVLVLLALGVIAIWPEHRPGPAPARAVAQNAAQPAAAQNAPAAAQPGGVAPADPAAPQAAEGALQDKLSRRITAEFVETPLPDVLQFLSDASDVQIFINRRAIESSGLTLNAPITVNLKSVRLDMLLDLVLEQVADGGLTYVDRDGILIVSTHENLEGASEVRVYNCRDLLAPDGPRPDKVGRLVPAAPGIPGLPVQVGPPAATPATPGPASGLPVGPGGPPGMGGMGGGYGGGMGGFGGEGMGAGGMVPLTEAQQRAESLKRLLQTAVKPGSWSEAGGIGTISEYNGLIVINHDAKTHRQIENVLKMLREAANLDPGKTAKIPKP